ncbi:hypothetical protein MD484_g4543, partial [Candolleomyces efflorescens]
MSTETKDTKETKACPVTFSSIFGYSKKDDKVDAKKTSIRRFPWKAFGGLALVTIAILLSIFLSIFIVIKLPFKIIGGGLWIVLKVLFWPISLIASLFKSSPKPLIPETTTLTCINTMELQGWEVLTLLPGSDGNPAAVKYTLNSPTPHALSVVDIDYRDTRVDILSNGKYYGSTSDFALNKTEFCGEDLNKCIAQGFSTGTVIIPGGKQDVELSWSGKDVFPGTDKIVWGGDRKRRVMWKKDLCL